MALIQDQTVTTQHGRIIHCLGPTYRCHDWQMHDKCGPRMRMHTNRVIIQTSRDCEIQHILF